MPANSGPATRTASVAYNFKVVLLGEGCVGKTSLVLRYIEDKFNPQHISTLQAAFVTKKITLPDDSSNSTTAGRRAQLNIWDTAGQERFHALGPIYYRGSQGAILVYDITDQDSFQKVKNWVRELKRMLGAEITIAIVGNKTDLEPERNVSYEEATHYAQTVGAHYFETSAKLNDNVTELFETLTRLMAEQRDAQRDQEQGSAMRLNNFNSRLGMRSIVLEDSADESNATLGDGDDDDDGDSLPNSATHRSCCGAG